MLYGEGGMLAGLSMDGTWTKIIGLPEEEVTIYHACYILKIFLNSNEIVIIIQLAHFAIKSKCEIDV